MHPIAALFLLILAIAIAFAAAKRRRIVIAFIASAFAAGMAFELVKGFFEWMGL